MQSEWRLPDAELRAYLAPSDSESLESMLLSDNEQAGRPGGEPGRLLAWPDSHIRAAGNLQRELETRCLALSAVMRCQGLSQEQVIHGICAERVTLDPTALHVPFEKAFAARGDGQSPKAWRELHDSLPKDIRGCWPNPLATPEEAKRYTLLNGRQDRLKEWPNGDRNWVTWFSRSLRHRKAVLDAVVDLMTLPPRTAAKLIQHGVISAERDGLRFERVPT